MLLTHIGGSGKLQGSTHAIKALFICASAFELLEKLADGKLNSWLFKFRCWFL
jgi:hypothetical protein